MATISLPGIYSSIDTTTLVAKLIQADSGPLTQLQTKKTDYTNKQAAVNDLQSRMTQLQDLVKQLEGTDNLQSVSATSSDRTIVDATSGKGAGEGLHSVVVNQLATADRLVQNTGLAAATSKVAVMTSTALATSGTASADDTWFTTGGNGATYSFAFGSEPALSVTLDPNQNYSINQVAALINAQSQALSGYNAASVQVDAQSGKSYLRLTAKDSATTGSMAQTLTAGDAVAALGDNAGWTKAAAGTGEFTYTYDGKTRTLNVTADTTLQGLSDLINSDADNPGVTASLLQYGSTYHLVLAGKDVGATHSITVNNAATTLGGFSAGDFVQTQHAQNSQFQIDGYPTGDAWMERDSNSISDVVPGVTLTLKNAGKATVTVGSDTSGLKQDLNNLVSIYNGLVDKVQQYTGYDATNKTGGILQGDSSMAQLLSGIRQAFVGAGVGFSESAGDSFSLPSEIGLQIDKTGHMSLDETTFDQALAKDYDGALALIGAKGIGASDNSHIQFTSADLTVVPGSYEVQTDFDAQGRVTAARIRTAGSTSWQDMGVNGNKLVGVTGTAGAGITLTAAWDGSSSSQSATIRVKKGFACAMYDSASNILNPVSGTMKSELDLFDSQLTSINTNIQTQTDRLTQEQTDLTAKFARLEATLAQLDQQKSAYQALFTSMYGSNNSNSSSSNRNSGSSNG